MTKKRRFHSKKATSSKFQFSKCPIVLRELIINSSEYPERIKLLETCKDLRKAILTVGLFGKVQKVTIQPAEDATHVFIDIWKSKTSVSCTFSGRSPPKTRAALKDIRESTNYKGHFDELSVVNLIRCCKSFQFLSPNEMENIFPNHPILPNVRYIRIVAFECNAGLAEAIQLFDKCNWTVDNYCDLNFSRLDLKDFSKLIQRKQFAECKMTMLKSLREQWSSVLGTRIATIGIKYWNAEAEVEMVKDIQFLLTNFFNQGSEQITELLLMIELPHQEISDFIERSVKKMREQKALEEENEDSFSQEKVTFKSGIDSTMHDFRQTKLMEGKLGDGRNLVVFCYARDLRRETNTSMVTLLFRIVDDE